ncbi:MAG: motility associated factor glycosyltransferase family protein [Nannocystaceae bacterium]|nr:DUF115 domain-containing protein [bacterium]
MTTEREALSAWDRVQQRLSALADAGTRVRQAVDAGDGRVVRDQVHQMRGIRAALARDQARTPDLPSSPAGVEFIAKLAPVRQRATEAAALAQTWLEREVPDDAVLRQSDDGYMTLAERLLPTVWDVDVDLVVLIGPDVCGMARALAAFGQQRIVVYAPTSLGAPPTDLPGHAIVVRDRNELDEVGKDFSADLPERMVAWRAGPEVSASLFERVNTEVREVLAAATVDRNTVAKFGDLWIQQGLANVPAIATLPAFAADGEFAGVPMVIVAPGPSLSKNVHLLKGLKGKAVVAAFSHTLSALSAAGVVPDLVLAADMEDLRYHFDGFDVEEVEALALAYTVHPDLFALPARRTLSFSSNRTDGWMGELLGEDAHVPNGGSVAHMAFSMGLKMGCNPIVLVGQDLSFPEGKVYCDGNVDEGARADVSDDGRSLIVRDYSDGYANMQSVSGAKQSQPCRTVQVPGHDGGQVVTTVPFAMFRRWFIAQAKSVASQDGSPTLLNCTEGGTHIDGMRHMPLADAIDAFMNERFDISARFDAMTDRGPSTRARATLARLEQYRTAVRHCQVTAKRGVALIKKVERGRANLDRLTEAEKALSAAIAPIRFLSLVAQKQIAEISAQGKDATTLQDNLASTRRLFLAVQKAAESIAPRIKRAAQQLGHACQEKRSA